MTGPNGSPPIGSAIATGSLLKHYCAWSFTSFERIRYFCYSYLFLTNPEDGGFVKANGNRRKTVCPMIGKN